MSSLPHLMNVQTFLHLLLPLRHTQDLMLELEFASGQVNLAVGAGVLHMPDSVSADSILVVKENDDSFHHLVWRSSMPGQLWMTSADLQLYL